MANRIIIVTGPQEGVGKSTLAANLATQCARIRRQPVLLVDADLLCRGELMQIAGTQASPTVLDILDLIATSKVAIPMLRGRVPMNDVNVGCVQLAAHTRDAAQLTPEQWGLFLEGFSQLYDIFVDIEMSHPLRNVALDVADSVVWTLLPNALAVKATLQQFDQLQNHKYSVQ